jgi:DNA-directed RNA polymerase subunit delta
MKRVIKNYNTIEAHHIALIEESYPLGISQDDIISLRMPDGKYLSCLEVKTEDTVYLFRMDGGMIQMLEEETGEDFSIDGDDLDLENGDGGESGGGKGGDDDDDSDSWDD